MRFLFSLLIALFVGSLLFTPSVLAAPGSKNEFGGIGAQVVPTATGEVVVLQLVQGAPAATKGLLPGDLIIEINGVTLKGLDFKQVTREHLWGFVGESVHVGWLRPGDTVKREADLVRVKIDKDSLRHPDVRMIKPKK